MKFLSGWFGTKYDDARLESIAKIAVDEDPLVNDPTDVLVSSKQGVVELSGAVRRHNERERIEGAVRTAFQHSGIKFERITNELKVLG